MQNLKIKNKLYLNFIYLFFSIVLSISSSASPITNEDDAANKQTCYHDLSTKNYDIQPFKKEGFEHYPKYLADFVMSGIRLVGDQGDFGYYLENVDSDLNYYCCTLDNHTSNVNTINLVKAQFQMYDMDIPHRIGFANNKYLALGVNPKYKKNWIKTMKFLEQHLLSKEVSTKKRKSKKKSSANIFSVSTKSIIRLLEMSHWRLSTNLKANNKFEINQGKYRTEGLLLNPEASLRDNCIYREKIDPDVPELDFLQVLELRGINSDEFYLLRNFKYQLELHAQTLGSFEPGDLDSIMQKFSPKKQKIINKYMTIAPDAPEIKKLMKNFAKEFTIKGKLVDKGILHPITFAAWIHTEIIKITPFVDCNGKLARLWMNAFLLRYGYLAPILTNEEDYLDAVKKELNGETNAFADYIAQQIELTTKYFSDPNGNPKLELSLDKL